MRSRAFANGGSARFARAGRRPCRDCRCSHFRRQRAGLRWTAGSPRSIGGDSARQGDLDCGSPDPEAERASRVGPCGLGGTGPVGLGAGKVSVFRCDHAVTGAGRIGLFSPCLLLVPGRLGLCRVLPLRRGWLRVPPCQCRARLSAAASTADGWQPRRRHVLVAVATAAGTISNREPARGALPGHCPCSAAPSRTWQHRNFRPSRFRLGHIGSRKAAEVP